MVVAALPVLCAWAPATVSTACDDLLDQLNDLSFLGAATASLWKQPYRLLSARHCIAGSSEHRMRVTHLRHSLMNLTRGQGLGFQVAGTVIDKRMLVTTAGGPVAPGPSGHYTVFPLTAGLSRLQARPAWRGPRSSRRW